MRPHVSLKGANSTMAQFLVDESLDSCAGLELDDDKPFAVQRGSPDIDDGSCDRRFHPKTLPQTLRGRF